MTILKAIKFKHGNLFSPFEGPGVAKKAYDDLSQVYGNNSQIDIYSYGADIKEMYTFFPQDNQRFSYLYKKEIKTGFSSYLQIIP